MGINRMNIRIVFVFSLCLTILLLGSGTAHAQQTPSALESQGVTDADQIGEVQELSGSIREGDVDYYLLSDLRRGQTLTVLAEGLSGNLDPVIGLLNAADDLDAKVAAYNDAIQAAIESEGDALIALDQSRDELLLAWDDDSGSGLAASLAYTIPADGDYRLIVSSALSSVRDAGFGRYRLLVGVDAPDVLAGDAVANSDMLVTLDREASSSVTTVQEINASINPGLPTHVYELEEMQPGDTFYAWIETTAGELRPTLILRDYADKPLRAVNLNGENEQAALEYTLEDIGRNYQLDVTACCEADSSSGDYRLLLGVNAPDVLVGEASPTELSVVMASTPVAIGFKLQQVVEVNEANEFFTIVGSLQMEWVDRALAFSPDECQCLFKSFAGPTFSQFLTLADNRWPDFTFFNQQGNRWSQNRVAVVFHDGRVLYFERFTTNLQVDFDFEQYPFDTQEFTVKVDSIYPDTLYHFTELEGYSAIDPDHGEDEFIITGFETEITTEQASTQFETSRFTFSYSSPRHLDYYMLQIFIPILLIVGVSWITFFLKDYGRRIEVASGNLLLFIAFSFSLSDNYPRLGYVTFLDSVMAAMFVVNALVVVYNVWLKRMEMAGDAPRAERIDNVMDWVYPFSYVAISIGLYVYFFVL
jgi:hypothetical protein